MRKGLDERGRSQWTGGRNQTKRAGKEQMKGGERGRSHFKEGINRGYVLNLSARILGSLANCCPN